MSSYSSGGFLAETRWRVPGPAHPELRDVRKVVTQGAAELAALTVKPFLNLDEAIK